MSKYLRFQSLRLVRLLLASSGMLLMVACSNLNPIGLLTGGGPNVAANTQAGKTNTQTIGTTTINEQELVRPQARDIRQTADTNQVRSDSVETVVVNELPVWMIGVFLMLLVMWSYLLWMLPSPDQIWKKK